LWVRRRDLGTVAELQRALGIFAEGVRNVV